MNINHTNTAGLSPLLRGRPGQPLAGLEQECRGLGTTLLVELEHSAISSRTRQAGSWGVSGGRLILEPSPAQPRPVPATRPRRRGYDEQVSERDPSTGVTELLGAIGAGDEQARERLFELLYDELRGVARGQIAGGPSRATIQATALVNEAYLRLVGKAGPSWENRRHFFFVASRAMRDVLVEEARAKSAQRRGGNWKRQSLAGLEISLETPADQLLALDEALAAIEAADPRRGEIVRLRFFAGLTEDETAEMLQISKRTISREWGLARADLALFMNPPDAT